MHEEKNLPAACGSPRIMGGVLKWYAGDQFDLQVRLELTDQNGVEVPIASEHRVRFLFRNAHREEIYAVTFTEIRENTVVLHFGERETALFPKGRYTYDVIYEGAVRRTLASNAPVLVE